MDEVKAFLEPDRLAHALRIGGRRSQRLSPRDRDVLRLAAEGRTNDEIADAMTLSVRTVERHLANTYPKLRLPGRAARTAAVAEYLTQHLD